MSGFVFNPFTGNFDDSGKVPFTVSASAPTSPKVGDLWWDTGSGCGFVYYDDGDTGQWVSVDSGAQTLLPAGSDKQVLFNDGGFAVGADAGLTFDKATGLLATPLAKIGGDTDYASFAADGTLTLNGDATAWDDLLVPSFGVKVTGTSPPDLATGFGPSSTIDYYAFDGASTLEQVYFSVQMPHRWKVGSTIYPHVHFAPTSTNTGDTTQRAVRFTLEYCWSNIGSAFGNSATFNMDSDAFVPNTSLWSHLLAKNANGIDGTGKTLSSVLHCRLFRDPTDATDTYPQDVAFLFFDIHYEIDGFGSSLEYTK